MRPKHKCPGARSEHRGFLSPLLKLRNPCLQSLNSRELKSICVDHQHAMMQPCQGEKLVVSEVASAHIDRILVGDDLGTLTPAPEGHTCDFKKCADIRPKMHLYILFQNFDNKRLAMCYIFIIQE